ncbi:MAG: TldD/PmbA family protein [Candidatus Sericytochromatia bacterium]|nr:TldD/PmbA family protein [Candidatus Sericytochromatia bacterium]
MTPAAAIISWEEDALRGLAQEALALCEADEAEVVLQGTDQHLARFSAGTLHQHTAEQTLELRIRAIRNDRVGVATTTDLSRGGLERVSHRAVALAARQAPDPHFPGLPGPCDFVRIPEAHHEATASRTPQEREATVRTLVQAAQTLGGTASGHHATSRHVLAVANTRCLWGWHAGTRAEWSVVAQQGEATGYAARLSPDVMTVDPAGLAKEAMARAIPPLELPATLKGTHRVMLEPYAVADWLTMLAYMGFGATSVAQGTSFLCEAGETSLTSPILDLWDNPLDPLMPARPFDAEGTPKQPLALLKNGVGQNCVHDRRSARQAGRSSTGHALPPPNPYGAFPAHLDLGPGDRSRQELLDLLGDGLLITRFHYISVLDPRQARLTGLTRDGVLQVRQGKIVGACRNARYTGSILEALRGVVGVGKDAILMPSILGSVRCPAVVLEALALEP